MKPARLVAVGAFVLGLAAQTAAQPRDSAWPQGDAAALGFAADMPAKLDALLPAQAPRVTSFGVLRNGRLAYGYFRDGAITTGYREDPSPAASRNVASVTKSVLALLYGVALDKGVVKSIDEPISNHLREAADAALDPRVRALTFRHLLTMTAGWESWDTDLPPFDFVDSLRRPFVYAPGERFQYDNATSNILGIALARAAGTTLERFAEEHLFEPLGIRNYRWLKDARGNTMGWHNLHLTLDDMLKIGQLVLDEGAWQGRQIVPADWIRAMLTRRNAGGPPSNIPYGYHWYVVQTPDRAHESYGAFGYGGQLIYVVPALKLVIAKTQTRDRRDGDVAFIREIVMPGLKP